MDLKFEGVDLEYKKAKNNLPESFWETYSAFANTNGGKIILGIDEKNIDPYQGVNNPQKIRDNLFALVANKKLVVTYLPIMILNTLTFQAKINNSL